MTTTAMSFFATEQNKAAIRNFSATLRSLQPLAPPYPEIVQPLRSFFTVLEANTDAFDQHCPINIDWLGSRYIGLLVNFMEQRSEKAAEQLLDIFTTSYRLLCELEFSLPGELSIELRSIKNFVDENLESFQGVHRSQLVYANYIMPANVAKRLMNDPSLADFKAFASSALAAKNLKEAWDKELVEKRAEIDGLRDAIDRVKTRYNFVGLVKGFEALVEAKQSERRRSFIALLVLGALMLVPVCAQLGYVLSNSDKIASHLAMAIYTVPAILTIELILLYFFRVVLLNYRGLQTQLLQLDLRITLCQFIQSYAEYSAKIKKADPAALERFEAVVFSSVISDSEKLPTTFDGVEQLAKLVKSIRG